MRTTDGTLLGGRLRYAQPEDGYRTGIEPVLLAAGVPARPGQRVLEAGTGAGAGLMCLAARVPGITGVGIESDPEMAELARRNIHDNGLSGLQIVTADIGAAAGLGSFDHAFANPPWHDPASMPSPNPRRQLAKQAHADWFEPMRRLLGPRGEIAMLLPVAQLGRTIAGLLDAGFSGMTVVPFWPKAGRAAKLMLVRGRLRARADGISPGLVLHEAGGNYTEAADAVLRAGGALPG